ncbi:unnamed protein product [Zymoseptoria tritici ST99CH_3D7]|uniref:Uncharacterized protein n=1 Tax=Zymoseptoria tritici (strain ST99CH_3D7) TaxID=1276538 RepID=A0A1X7RQ37_ZYMT9|nr:unnamed protein product [Zymoseptoria tritici ST99CH_3D7]
MSYLARRAAATVRLANTITTRRGLVGISAGRAATIVRLTSNAPGRIHARSTARRAVPGVRLVNTAWRPDMPAQGSSIA